MKRKLNKLVPSAWCLVLSAKKMLAVALCAVGLSAFANEPDAVQLWKDGPYFATCNVGAETPEDAGYYFWWGDTVGYTNNNAAVDDDVKWLSVADGTTSIMFSTTDATAKQTYKKDFDTLKSEGWIDDSGNLVVSNDETNRDAARAHLGEPWRMMTKEELDELVKCPYTAINTAGTEFKDNGDTFAGYRVTGQGDYAGNSIFLPVTGSGSVSYLKYTTSAYYGSSTPKSSDPFLSAWSLAISSSKFAVDDDSRYYGRPVRAVRDTPPPTTVAGLSNAFALDLTVGDRMAQPTETLVVDPAWGNASEAAVKLKDGWTRTYTCASNDLWDTTALTPGRYILAFHAGAGEATVMYGASFWKTGADWVVFDGSNVTENTAFEADKTYLILGTNTVADSKTLTVTDGAKFEYAADAGFNGGEVTMSKRYVKKDLGDGLYQIVEAIKGSADNPWVVGNDGETPSPHEVEAYTNGNEFVIGGKGTISDLSEIEETVKTGTKKLTITEATVTGAEDDVFAGVGGEGAVEVSLPDNWQGELPDASGALYGMTVDMTKFVYPKSVRNVKFQQRYPWNGLVDVICDLSGAGTVTLGATVLTNGVTLVKNPTLKDVPTVDLDAAGGVTNGVKFIWNAAADLPAGFKAQGVTIKVTVEK